MGRAADGNPFSLVRCSDCPAATPEQRLDGFDLVIGFDDLVHYQNSIYIDVTFCGYDVRRRARPRYDGAWPTCLRCAAGWEFIL